MTNEELARIRRRLRRWGGNPQHSGQCGKVIGTALDLLAEVDRLRATLEDDA